MGGVTFKVEGFKELDEALAEFKVPTQKAILRRVAKAALQPVDGAWRAAAPHLTGALQKSGGVGATLSRRQRAEHVREADVEEFVGPGPLPQAIQEEFGNSHQHPAPFMRPAWDSHKDGVLESVKTQLKTEVDKAAARAARKAAKLIALNGG